MSRTYCASCGRPPVVCLCDALVSLSPATRVVVLAHPREAYNAIGTGWMVERCFGARRFVGVELQNDAGFLNALSDRAAPPILLSPGPDALDLNESPPAGPVTLVVLDGTWGHVRSLLRHNPILRTIPRYAFSPPRPSNYRIRREPGAACVSTIEATVYALAVLEPLRGSAIDPSLALRPFEVMVDRQIVIAQEKKESRHLRAAIARRVKKGLPLRRAHSLAGRELVVVHGEANAWPRGSTYCQNPELVHVLAERLSTGERFEALVKPSYPLSPGFSHHTGIADSHVMSGEAREAFRARFAEFLREGDQLAVWGSYVYPLLAREMPNLPTRVDLRAYAIKRLGRAAGDTKATADALGAPEASPWTIGRTALRMCHSTRVARVLARDDEPAPPWHQALASEA